MFNKKIASEFALGIIVILAIIFGGYLWSQSQQNESSPASSKMPVQDNEIKKENNRSVDEVAEFISNDWQNYRNEKYGFELQYPSDLYLFENNDLYEKMCEAEMRQEGAVFDDGEKCLGNSMIVNFSNINGFCTKGGCVDEKLKPIRSFPSKRMGFSIQKISLKEKNNLIHAYKYENDFKNYTINLEINTFDVYIVRQTENPDWFPYMDAFITAKKGDILKFTTATEIGTEEEEIKILEKILSTFKFIN